MTQFVDQLLVNETDCPPAAELRPDGTVREVHHQDGATEAPDDGDTHAIVLIPSLRDLVAAYGLNSAKLTVAFETDGQGHIRMIDRHSIALSDGNQQ